VNSTRIRSFVRWLSVLTVATLLIAVSEGLVHRLAGVPVSVTGRGLGPLGLSWVATLLVVGAMWLAARRSDLSGRSLVLALGSAVLGLNVVLTQVEAAVFLDMTGRELLATTLGGTCRALIVTGLLGWMIAGRGPASAEGTGDRSPRSASGWIGRFGAASFAYLVLYFVAGLLIYPFVRSFYETQNLDVGLAVFPLQLVRGALYVVFALPLLRSLVGSPGRVALTVALLFPALAGAPDLLLPNPFLPDWVRPFHLVEVGASNFVFGWIVGRLFRNPRAGSRTDEAPAKAGLGRAGDPGATEAAA